MENMEITINNGADLRDLRLKNKLSQKQLAERAHTGQSRISAWELGTDEMSDSTKLFFSLLFAQIERES